MFCSAEVASLVNLLQVRNELIEILFGQKGLMFCTFLDAKIVESIIQTMTVVYRTFVAINHQEIKVQNFQRPVRCHGKEKRLLHD